MTRVLKCPKVDLAIATSLLLVIKGTNNGKEEGGLFEACAEARRKKETF